eukprot:TRINITY_DN5420_c0_g1_i3.p1 TRINITY_DN5420_c0_g1~~TRINITY_DN5420_c0_g1_i3.p1  ORF type:complete len:485 (-),score=145.06 TRINITY_DN5420_c0_g1_i3:134-1588(-)
MGDKNEKKMNENELKWMEIFYRETQSEGPNSIYNSTVSIFHDRNVLFVASKSKVFGIFTSNSESGSSLSLPFSPSWHFLPVHLSGISAEMEIICIDSISEETVNLSINERSGSGPILAIAAWNPNEKKGLLNIYGVTKQGYIPHQSEDLSNAFSVVDVLQSIPLNFVPFQLGHATYSFPSFLLSGSDSQIHIYQFQNTASIYPQMSSLPSTPISFDIKIIKSRRIMAIGCQNGYTQLSITDLSNQVQSIVLDGPVSSIRIFETRTQKSSMSADVPTLLAHNPLLSQLHTNVVSSAPLPVFSSEDEIYVVAADATGMGVLFHNIQKSLLKQPQLLPKSDQFDSITCIAIADIDFDGYYELLLGTYGQQVLIYKERETDTVIVQPEVSGVGSERRKEKEFYLVKKLSFLAPVMSLYWSPLIPDGTHQLVVVTLNGVHILQPDLEKAKEKVVEVMNIANELMVLESQLLQATKKQDDLKRQLEQLQL